MKQTAALILIIINIITSFNSPTFSQTEKILEKVSQIVDSAGGILVELKDESVITIENDENKMSISVMWSSVFLFIIFLFILLGTLFFKRVVFAYDSITCFNCGFELKRIPDKGIICPQCGRRIV